MQMERCHEQCRYQRVRFEGSFQWQRQQLLSAQRAGVVFPEHRRAWRSQQSKLLGVTPCSWKATSMNTACSDPTLDCGLANGHFRLTTNGRASGSGPFISRQGRNAPGSTAAPADPASPSTAPQPAYSLGALYVDLDYCDDDKWRSLPSTMG